MLRPTAAAVAAALLAAGATAGTTSFSGVIYAKKLDGTCSADPSANAHRITTVDDCQAAVNQVAPDATNQPSTEAVNNFPVGCYLYYNIPYVNAGQPDGSGADCSDQMQCVCATGGSGPAPGPAPDSPGGGTQAAADDLGVPDCTAGCAFLIVFFVGGFVYVAAGVAINYKYYEKRGFDAIPHGSFWKDVPFMVKDGMVFAVRKARGQQGEYTAV